LLPDFSERTADRIAERAGEVKRAGDVVVLSIHWGGNWGYEILREHRAFAHRLMDSGGVDILHGHSSHHPKGIEIYRGKPIFYGCGDLLNDYEGISGYEEFRGHLALMYFVTVDRSTGSLLRLEMMPFEIKRFQLQRATHQDATWLEETLNREGKRLATQVILRADNRLILHGRGMQ
jgi:poly-gamma-glutamate synthesis protein (capsule biosynthesis protein)